MLNKLCLIMFSACFIFISCSGDETISPVKNNKNRDLNQSEQSLVESDNAFGLKIFKAINESEDENTNIFISPLSISMAIGMTLNGAAGDTKEAIEKTLELNGLTTDEINKSYRSLIDLFKGLDNNVQFDIANSIWTRSGFTPLPSFVDVNKKYFDAEIRELDFSQPDAKDIINGWVEEKTNNKIKDLIAYIPPNAVMYLINAIYFNGSWKYEFDKEKTFDAMFSTEQNGLAACQYMIQDNKFDYFGNNEYSTINLPYGNGVYSMAIFLPRKENKIDEFLSEICDPNWSGWAANYEETELTLTMPKFKFDSDYNLNDVLKNLGMDIAFGGDADLSKLFGGTGFFISNVEHKTFVEVNETGTEAAAATSVEISYECATPRMDLTRPFIFVIKENKSGSIMFMGKIGNPALD